MKKVLLLSWPKIEGGPSRNPRYCRPCNSDGKNATYFLRRYAQGDGSQIHFLIWFDTWQHEENSCKSKQNVTLEACPLCFCRSKTTFLPVQIVLEGSKCWWFFPKITFQCWILLFDPWLRHFHSDQDNLDWSKIILDLQKDKALILIGMREVTFIPLSFLDDLTLSAEFLSKISKNFGGENWHQSG